MSAPSHPGDPSEPPDADPGGAGLWPSADYHRQVERLRAAVGETVYLARRDPRPRLVQGRAETLLFADSAFDGAVAMTSLCFCADPARALRELWRVSRRVVLLGLLHWHRLLHWTKAGRGGYQGARWDTRSAVRAWTGGLTPAPALQARTALRLPGTGPLARWIERPLAARLPLGGFLAVALRRAGPAGCGRCA